MVVLTWCVCWFVQLATKLKKAFVPLVPPEITSPPEMYPAAARSVKAAIGHVA